MRHCGRPTGAVFPADRPVFYYVTDRSRLPDNSIRALVRRMRRAIAAGVDIIQIREKDLTDHDLLALTEDAVGLAHGTGCRVLVNGRFDVALAGGAHGVHLPSTGLTCSALRSYLPRTFLLGASAHSIRQAQLAAKGGAHYVLMGPVFRTPSKLRYGEPVGLECLRRTCKSVRIPVLGLGGIHFERIREVLDTGAAGIAGIALFQNAGDLGFLRKWNRKSTIEE